jgi:hypothetical protein
MESTLVWTLQRKLCQSNKLVYNKQGLAIWWAVEADDGRERAVMFCAHTAMLCRIQVTLSHNSVPVQVTSRPQLRATDIVLALANAFDLDGL